MAVTSGEVDSPAVDHRAPGRVPRGGRDHAGDAVDLLDQLAGVGDPELALLRLDDEVAEAVVDGLLVEEDHDPGDDGGEEDEVDEDHREDRDGQEERALVPPGDQPGGEEQGDLLILEHRRRPARFRRRYQ